MSGAKGLSRRDALVASLKASMLAMLAPILGPSLARAANGPGASLDNYLHDQHGIPFGQVRAQRDALWKKYFPLEAYTPTPAQNTRLLNTIWASDSIAPRVPQSDLNKADPVMVTILPGSVIGIESELARSSLAVQPSDVQTTLGDVHKPGIYYVRLYGTNGAVLHGHLTLAEPSPGKFRVSLKLVGDTPSQGTNFTPKPIAQPELALWRKYTIGVQDRMSDKAKSSVVPWMADNAVAIGKMGLICVTMPVALNTIVPVGGAARGMGYCVLENASLGLDFIKELLIGIAKDMQLAGEITKDELGIITAALDALDFITQLALGTFQEELVPIPAETPDLKKLQKACKVSDVILKVLDSSGSDILKLNENTDKVFKYGVQFSEKVQFLWCNKELLSQ